MGRVGNNAPAVIIVKYISGGDVEDAGDDDVEQVVSILRYHDCR